MSLSFKEQWKKNFSKSDARCFEEKQILLLFAASAVRLFVASKDSIYIHVLAENRAFLPHLKYVDERKMSKNRDLGQNILPRSAWVRLSETGIRFVWRRWTARRRRRSVEPFVQPYNSVNFIELPSSFLCPRNVLIFVPPSGLLSGTFLSKWPDPTPKFTKRSDRRRIRFCSYSFLFHLVFSISFLNRIQTAESSGWLQSNFMFFLLWNFYSCRVTLHYSPACGLYYVFVLLQRPVSIYTKRIFRGVSSHLGTQLRQFEQLVKISFAIWLYRNFTFHVCFFSE